jgi:hypothetical protein
VTQYINPTSYEVWRWHRTGACVWCGGKCAGGSCRLRYCDSCSQYWLADSEADYREFDKGGQATVAPAMEECPDCVREVPILHLRNEAASFAYGDQ